jgi:rRNA maturation endonuclease Nob1
MIQSEVQQLKPASQDGNFTSTLMVIIFVVAAIVFLSVHVKNWLTTVYRCYECKAVLPEKATFCQLCQDRIANEHFK